jgi:hypothetical protein
MLQNGQTFTRKNLSFSLRHVLYKMRKKKSAESLGRGIFSPEILEKIIPLRHACQPVPITRPKMRANNGLCARHTFHEPSKLIKLFPAHKPHPMLTLVLTVIMFNSSFTMTTKIYQPHNLACQQ